MNAQTDTTEEADSNPQTETTEPSRARLRAIQKLELLRAEHSPTEAGLEANILKLADIFCSYEKNSSGEITNEKEQYKQGLAALGKEIKARHAKGESPEELWLYYFEQEDIIYSKHIGDVPRKTYTYEPIPAEKLEEFKARKSEDGISLEEAFLNLADQLCYSAEEMLRGSRLSDEEIRHAQELLALGEELKERYANGENVEDLLLYHFEQLEIINSPK